jgi:membrane associated rhomboid family serine protease
MQQFRPTRFEILPTVIKNLLIINGLVFLALNFLPSDVISKMMNNFALHAWQSIFFKPWQFVTHMFMQQEFWHLFGNMFALWVFGSVLENVWGPKRFLIFYFVCGLGAAFCHMIALHYEMKPIIEIFNSYDAVQQADLIFNPAYKLNTPTIGASGAVFGCLAAFGYLFPNTQLYIWGVLPLKAKWVVILYAGYELSMTIRNSAGDNVAHIAHLGGALVGIILVYFWNKTNRRTFY